MVAVYLFLCFYLSNILCYGALCNSVEYSNKIRSILQQQTEYNIITEGTFLFAVNSTNWGANPSSVYGLWSFDNSKEAADASQTWYMRSQSAIIFGGCTAPQSVYMSFVPYLYKRFNYIKNNKTHKSETLFASLSASLNNLVLNISSNLAYNSLTTIIHTADQQTFNDLNNLLINNGISSSEINLESLPNQYINFLPYEYNKDNVDKYNGTYDTAGMLNRIALPYNTQQFNQYISINQTVYMVQPKNAKGSTPRKPFGINIRNTYSTKNINESNVYNVSLNEYKNDLITYLENTYKMKFISEINFKQTATPNSSRADYGFSCIQNNIDCFGDNRDAQYWSTSSGTKLKNDSFYIVLGVIHTNIQQTLYSNIVVYENSYYPDYNATLTNFDYNGSALILPVNTKVNKDILQNLFVIQLSRPYSCINGLPGWCLNEKELDYNAGFDFHERNYLNHFTATRPDMSEIVGNILLQFTTS
eukprot:26713_1